MLSSPLARSFFSGLAGFVVYGGWAYFVNESHGQDLAMMIGLVQGSYSFALTFVMTLVTEWLFLKCNGQFFTIMAIVCTALFVTPYLIHMLIGTPEILMTILPGFVIGSIYTGVYVVGLKKVKVEALSVAND